MADARLLPGRPVADHINQTTADRISALVPKLGRKIRLAVLAVDGPAGQSYLKSIRTTAAKLEIELLEVSIKEGASTDSVTGGIKGLNRDESIDGILVQTPLPEKVNLRAVSGILEPAKDVDGITPVQAGYLYQNDPRAIVPSTARAAMEILDFYSYGLEGLEVIVLGRSLVIGKPFGLLALAKNATVTYCHSRTVGLKAICKRADILIAAVGKPKMVDQAYVRPGATVIDVGINVDDEGKLCGDVDSEDIRTIAAAYTPVPGGVGPVTTSCLFANLVDATRRRTSSRTP